MPLYEYKCPACKMIKQIQCKIKNKPSHLHCKKCRTILKEVLACNTITYFPGHSKTPVAADMNAEHETKVNDRACEDREKERATSKRKFVQGVDVPKKVIKRSAKRVK